MLKLRPLNEMKECNLSAMQLHPDILRTHQVVQVADGDVAEDEHETREDDLQVDVLRVLNKKVKWLQC